MNVFCGTLKTQDQNLNQETDDSLGLKLFKIKLSNFKEFIPSLEVHLTTLEQNRANKYHFIKDKNRFLICRMLLKFILAEHIGVKVSKICIEYSANKKPYLPSHPSVFFNVTHSDEYAVIAIANSAVGVDIEYVNSAYNYQEILSSVFSKPEIKEINNSDHKHRTFYKLWTRKEAFVKATGKGIDDNIFEIPSLDDFHNVRSELLENIKKLQIFSFELGENFMGAIALTDITKQLDKLIFYPLPVTFQELLSN